MKSIAIGEGRSGHAEVEVASDLEITRQLGVLEVADAGRVDAGIGELVVEPRRGAVAQVRADRGVDRGQHLQEHEHRTEGTQRAGELVAPLDRPDHHTGGDGQQGGQHAAQREDGPPEGGQPTVGLGDHPGEAPLLTGAQAADHGATPSVGACMRSMSPIVAQGCDTRLGRKGRR